MDARSIIAKVRASVPLNGAEITWFIQGLASEGVNDAQAGAFAMAVCLNGLSQDERIALTLAMRDSGKVVSWDLPGPVLDKHSTGGVGDCVSLLLAPALAAAGAYVPMISGRGLGHTGGTLDKLEAIPGLKTEVSEARFGEIVERVGCAIVSATGQIAPADKRLYAIRDVTSTVQSLDLITASILSKKLAAGLEGLVLDVKYGSGAFMKSKSDASELAEALVSTANGAGCPTCALVTDMNQPAVSSLGNALELMEIMKVLTGGKPAPSLTGLTVALGGELLALGGVTNDVSTGEALIVDALNSGAAAERFGRMISALGGPNDFVERWRDRLPGAPVVLEILSPQMGRVTAIDGEALGMAVVHLGGGRLFQGARIDPGVGLSQVARLGDAVDRYTPLARIHAAELDVAEAMAPQVAAAFTIGAGPVDIPPLIYQRIS